MKQYRKNKRQFFNSTARAESGLLRRAEKIRRAVAVAGVSDVWSRECARRFLADLSAFGRMLEEHFRIEEKILFPFIRRHVPRAEASILVLFAEHHDLRRELNFLKKSVRRLERVGSGEILAEERARLYEAGTHLVHLLRHHIQHETRGVHRIAREDLRASEKTLLHKLMVSANC